MELPREVHVELYTKLCITREFEETAARLFAEGKVHGTAHFCIGEEATGVGVSSALTREDYILQHHRGHGQGIGKGMSIKRMMAEFLGKESGYCKGRGGCMHIADFAVGSLGANGIVGGGIPIAVGAALTIKYLKQDKIAVTFFGDGATNEGSFHEALNLASIWSLPVLFVCTNNYYGMSTHIRKATNIEDLSVRASAYGIRGVSLDGNDVINIYKEAKKARDYVRSSGPILMVLNTYRWMGHSKSDPQHYRTKSEVEEWKQRCPIARHKNYLLCNNVLTEEEILEIESIATEQVKVAVEFAMSSPEPTIETIYNDVYAP